MCVCVDEEDGEEESSFLLKRLFVCLCCEWVVWMLFTGVLQSVPSTPVKKIYE